MRLMDCCGVHDFSLKDIAKPEHKRLIKIFSAAINFAKFREEKVGAYDEYIQNTVCCHSSPLLSLPPCFPPCSLPPSLPPCFPHR
jgi:hypothetical protein